MQLSGPVASTIDHVEGRFLIVIDGGMQDLYSYDVLFIGIFVE